MIVEFAAGDKVVHGEQFKHDEVRYNLLHKIIEFPRSLKLKSADGSLIFAQSEGHNPWLWVSGELESAQRMERVRELVKVVQEVPFPGVTAEPETAKMYAEAWREAKGTTFYTYMMLEAYSCPAVHWPDHVGGLPVQAGLEHTAVIPEFMAGFMEDAFNLPTTPDSCLMRAEEAARSGCLYLWMADDFPAAIANIAHRSARHGRINDVYTPPASRKRGYASALVSALCHNLLQEGLTPVLYADAANPDSNKVYRSIGFMAAGRIAELKTED